MFLRATLLASAAVVALAANPATAQGAATEQQRQAVFQQMLANPSNRALMSQYAQLSVQLRDFEAAAATLERLVDLEPTNTEARIELAIAYFSLGAYDVAEYHLAAVQRAGGLTPPQADRVARYFDETQERGDGNTFGGRVSIGYAFTDQADESGAFANLNLDWRADLGDAHVTQWVSELAFTSYDPGATSGNDRTQIRFRTGPEFRIAGEAYNARLQPYLQVEQFTDNAGANGDFTSWEIGLAYQNPLNASTTVYGDFSYGAAYAQNFGFDDYQFYEVELGASYRPSRDTRLRASLRFEEQEEIDSAFPETTTLQGLRLSAQHAFQPGFSDVPNRWVVGAFGDFQTAEVTGAFSDAEIDTRYYGLWLRAFVVEDIFIEASAGQVMQETTEFGFTSETEEQVFALQIGWEF